ncbi:MAG: hypothetical protein AAGE01_05750 [Pseudomonadota bacterium]
MNSSTSSSEPMPFDTGAARRVNLKIFAIITLGMAACLGTFRIGIYLNDVSGDTIMSRVASAREQLPKVVAVDEPEIVMVFGSSMVQAGFGARQFDRELKAQGVTDVKSFNFGFGGLNPLFQDFLARRIRDEFVASDRRLRLAVIEFNPFQTTVRRRDGARPIEDTMMSTLMTGEEIWEVFLADPERGTQLFTIHYLRNDISAEATGSQFAGFLSPPRPRSELPVDEAAQAQREELNGILNERFEEDYPDYTGEPWYWDWQGSGTIRQERSEDTVLKLEQLYETLQTPRMLENDRLNRIHCCDIVEMHFDEELVEAFVRIVEVFKTFADEIEVVMLPRNTGWIQYPPEGRERLDAVLARLEAVTGIPVLDFQEVEGITPELFSDTTHLTRYGGEEVFTRFLADRYAPRLRAGGGN